MTPPAIPSQRIHRLIFAISIAFIAPSALLAQGSEVPRPVVDLKAGTANYKVSMEADGKTVTLDVTRTTKAVNNTWVLKQTTTTGKNVQTDELTVEKKTLLLRRRVFHEADAVAD